MKAPLVLRGNTWNFGDNVDTDQIIPARYAIYSLDEKKPGGPVPLADVKEQIRAALLFERRSQSLDELLLRLRTTAKIVTGRY